MFRLIPGLARLAPQAGSDATKGRTVVVSATLGHEPLARAIGRRLLRPLARYVEADLQRARTMRKIRLAHAADDALDKIPHGASQAAERGDRGRLDRIDGARGARLLDDVDPQRIGRDQVMIPERVEVVARQRMRSTIVPGPTPGWADSSSAKMLDALEKLSGRIGQVCRLDADDPCRPGATAARRSRARPNSSTAPSWTRSLHRAPAPT